MDHLWTPWRFHYIRPTQSASGCVFCQLPQEEDDRETLILARQKHSYIVLNKFPYTAGHLMVVSLRHVPNLAQSEKPELEEMMLLCQHCEVALTQVYQPNGFNIGLNIGRSAGAGVAGHLHLHVVPRWEGDGNFVSVVGQTRVIPEDLDTTYQKLAPHFRHFR